jgi:hypothetical protein
VDNATINLQYSSVVPTQETDQYGIRHSNILSGNVDRTSLKGRSSGGGGSVNRFINTQYSTASQLKWMMWYNEDMPELCAFPNTALLSLNVFQRLLFVISMRPDRFMGACIVAVASQPLISLDTAIFFRSMPTFRQMQNVNSDGTTAASGNTGICFLFSYYLCFS